MLLYMCKYGKHVFCKLELMDFNFSPYLFILKLSNQKSHPYYACAYDVIVDSNYVLVLKVVFNSNRNSCLSFVLVYQQ